MQASKGLVFDIKRFAMHDGAGIRTTLFLKGCPLRCRWCQNPEGLDPKQELIYFKRHCIHCGACAKEDRGIVFQGGCPHVLDRKSNHDRALEACPAQALQYDARYYTVEEVLKEVKKDEVFFQQEGGLTISGGEPFMQVDFLEELLKRCQQEGIHTTIESSFYTSKDNMKRVLPYLDAIYCDLKILDPKLHQEATGVDNRIILENIQLLLESQKAVTIRTPLIPGWSGTDENIAKIAQFLSGISSDMKYELLNYNPLASSKYHLYERNYGIDPNAKAYTKEEMDHFRTIAKENGIKNLVIE